MIKNMRCPACGRTRKKSHEKKVGTKKAYSPECKKYKLREGRQYFQKNFKITKALNHLFRYGVPKKKAKAGKKQIQIKVGKK